WVEERGADSRRELVGAVAGNATDAAGRMSATAAAGSRQAAAAAASGAGAEATAGAGGNIAAGTAAGTAAGAGGGAAGSTGTAGSEDTGSGSALSNTALDPTRASLRPKLFWFNLGLTVAVMVLLIADILPLPYLFMIATVIALLVNFPKMKDQQEELASHASAIISVVAMVMAAGVLTGIMSGTGMVDAMAAWLVDVIPDSMGPFMAVITGLLSIPMTFFMSNDAFYFGILPV